MTNIDDPWLQRVRYAAAEPTSWLTHARTLRQAAEDLWIAGNAHDRAPGSELGATVLVNWASPDFAPPLMGGSTCEVCFMLFGFALVSPTLKKRRNLDGWSTEGRMAVVTGRPGASSG